PDDGNRYELIDGELFVTPAPAPRHQQIANQLWLRLENTRPPDLVVLTAPLAVNIDAENEVQPDVLVAPFEDFAEKDLPTPPLLTVEVLSRSTSAVDLNKKKDDYERFGVPSYWVIDPVAQDLIAFELDENGRYQVTAKVAGDQRFETTRPFPVSFSVNELLGPFARR
ncbi:MAG TPA: Uma2 family endonuclease, partial [Pseudonocardiaceae bacterium]